MPPSTASTTAGKGDPLQSPPGPHPPSWRPGKQGTPPWLGFWKFLASLCLFLADPCLFDSPSLLIRCSLSVRFTKGPPPNRRSAGDPPRPFAMTTQSLPPGSAPRPLVPKPVPTPSRPSSHRLAAPSPPRGGGGGGVSPSTPNPRNHWWCGPAPPPPNACGASPRSPESWGWGSMGAWGIPNRRMVEGCPLCPPTHTFKVRGTPR